MVVYFMLSCKHNRAVILTWDVFTPPSTVNKASPPFWKQNWKNRRLKKGLQGRNHLRKTSASKFLPQLLRCHFHPVNRGRLTYFPNLERRVSFHIISVECLKMWFIERTQRGSVDTQEVHRPSQPAKQPHQMLFIYF